MKKYLLCLLSACLLLGLFAGCAAKQAAQEAPALTGGIEGEIEGEWSNCVYSSVEELKQAVSRVRLEGASEYEETRCLLAELESFYDLADGWEGFELFQIEVNPYNVMVYYMPVGSKARWFDHNVGIHVVTERPTDEMTLETVAEQYDLTPDEDGFLYNPERSAISFTKDGALISVIAPKSMGDYETLKALSNVKLVTVE